MEEDGEEEEGDDELEEIEEIEDGVFDGPPKKMKNRTTNYTEIEDTCLVWAWSGVTIDLVTGNDQIGKRVLAMHQRQVLQAHASSCNTGDSFIPFSTRLVGCDQSFL
jgi:hypothetical protein